MQTSGKKAQLPDCERDHASMGALGSSVTSSRAGYIPVSLDQLPVESLAEMSVFVRVPPDHPLARVTPDTDGNGFRLYASPQVRFAELHRRRLKEHSVKFVYIRIADHNRFRKQTEARLHEIAVDPAIAVAQRASIVYDTSKELINELLAEPTVASVPALQQVSRSVTSMVVKDQTAFSHLFAASHHDFYTATHLINVATWMVPLAYELGHHDPDLLGVVCQAGILHDMGKLSISERVLNKKGKLGEEEWAAIRRHPELGVEYLTKFGKLDPLIARVTLEHHERLDGSGYPRGLKGGDIHEISKLCAVVDSFDAMTAFRPFKKRTLSPTEALELIASETPAKYDPLVVRAWTGLVSKICSEPGRASAPSEVEPGPGGPEMRRYPRQKFNCQGRMHALAVKAGKLVVGPAIPIVAHNLSRNGMGVLCKKPVPPCEYVRIYLDAKGWADKPFEAQAIRCRGYSDSWHEIGLRFASFEAGDVRQSKAA
jgi:HD-GYP domain-containing protein (c-di-GMP phosphodiesterase class II)